MNTQMFLKVTEYVAGINIVNKKNLIIAGTGMKPNELRKYFEKVVIKRSRPIIDMKKNIAELITKVHNKKYIRNKDLIYNLNDIGKILDIKSHASILNYFKNEKTDDKLSLFVKENFLRWISEKKYPIPLQLKNQKNAYVMLNEDEINNITLNRYKKIDINEYNQFVYLKNREHYLNP